MGQCPVDQGEQTNQSTVPQLSRAEKYSKNLKNRSNCVRTRIRLSLFSNFASGNQCENHYVNVLEQAHAICANGAKNVLLNSSRKVSKTIAVS